MMTSLNYQSDIQSRRIRRHQYQQRTNKSIIDTTCSSGTICHHNKSFRNSSAIKPHQFGKMFLMYIIYSILALSSYMDFVDAVHGGRNDIQRYSHSRIIGSTVNKNTEFVVRSFSRGGATIFASNDVKDEENEEQEGNDDYDETTNENENDIRKHPDFISLQKYRMKQQVLLQMRGLMLSEALAKRGLPIPTIKDVTTTEETKIPDKIDWECAISTKEDPKTCALSLDAEEGTKVIAPLIDSNTGQVDQWVTLATLNRLRRNDASKVDLIWHKKYDVLKGWFNLDSKYSIWQHVDWKGVMLGILLNDAILPMAVLFGCLFLVALFMPIIEYFINRLLVSALIWGKWPSWARFVHMGLPFKLMVVQWSSDVIFKAFKRLVRKIKTQLVEMECAILEDSIPLTTGVLDDAQIRDDEEMVLEHLVEEDDNDNDYD